jgi:hypothetical protein
MNQSITLMSPAAFTLPAGVAVGAIRLMGDHALKMQMLSLGTYQINLKQGEAILLCPGTDSSSQPVQPSSPRSQRNH